MGGLAKNADMSDIDRFYSDEARDYDAVWGKGFTIFFFVRSFVRSSEASANIFQRPGTRF